MTYHTYQVTSYYSIAISENILIILTFLFDSPSWMVAQNRKQSTGVQGGQQEKPTGGICRVSLQGMPTGEICRVVCSECLQGKSAGLFAGNSYRGNLQSCLQGMPTGGICRVSLQRMPTGEICRVVCRECLQGESVGWSAGDPTGGRCRVVCRGYLQGKSARRSAGNAYRGKLQRDSAEIWKGYPTGVQRS